jgi:hypothetical protein
MSTEDVPTQLVAGELMLTSGGVVSAGVGVGV